MLEGLAKSLRKFGIDCLSISSEQRDYCLEIAIREYRYILTKGHRYERVSFNVIFNLKKKKRSLKKIK